jgi:cell division protein ZapA (FtsZ GTPase activity inhibitor)
LKKTYAIDLMGRKMTVASDAGEEHVRTVVDIVNKKATETADFLDGGVSELTLSLLTALNIADEYVSFRDGKIRSEEGIEAETKKLISLIESVQ